MARPAEPDRALARGALFRSRFRDRGLGPRGMDPSRKRCGHPAVDFASLVVGGLRPWRSRPSSASKNAGPCRRCRASQRGRQAARLDRDGLGYTDRRRSKASGGIRAREKAHVDARPIRGSAGTRGGGHPVSGQRRRTWREVEDGRQACRASRARSASAKAQRRSRAVSNNVKATAPRTIEQVGLHCARRSCFLRAGATSSRSRQATPLDRYPMPPSIANSAEIIAFKSKRPCFRSWPTPSIESNRVGAGIRPTASSISAMFPNGSDVPCTKTDGT
jgi:hypothetical protein